MARSAALSLTTRFAQLVDAPQQAAHRALLNNLARQPVLASALLYIALG
jgi:hypothetical protein